MARDLSKGLLSPIYVRLLHKFYVNDIWIDVRLAAKKEAVDYILEHMRAATVLRDRYHLLRFALSKAPSEGLIAEFGVEKGLSIRCLGKSTQRQVHGFDSFEGLPLDWDGTTESKGDFTTKGKLPRTPANVRLHVGWFDQTLPKLLSATQEKAAFIHIDCDIYESTKYVLETMSDRIVPGTIIVFDEYFNYPAWKLHEFKAFREFVEAGQRSYRYIGYSEEKGHVAVQML